MQEEIFKDIVGYEGLYHISNLGNVKSLERKVRNSENSFRIVKEKTLNKYINNRGYLTVSLSKNSKIKTNTIHVIMAMSFLNHKPNWYKTVVDHKNNKPLDNRLKNLQLVTNRKNTSKDRIGTSKYTGVCWAKTKNKWLSAIYINGKSTHLGYFTNEIEASNAYQEALNNLQQH